MHIFAVGANHKTAPLSVREKLSVAPSRLREALRELLSRQRVQEAVLLSTCNRTEVYAAGPTVQHGELVHFLLSHNDLKPEETLAHLTATEDLETALHLFRVTGSVDSMVVGEQQILGQVREAYEAAAECGAAGHVMAALFQRALRVGKRARSETDISRGAFSVGHCAVELAESVFGDLSGKRVLVLGAGEMAKVTATHLAEKGARAVFVANRTHERARQLAQQLGGEAIRYESLGEFLKSVDILISSTSAPHHVLGQEDMTAAMRARREAPMLLIDIAVPRDIDPQVEKLENVYLYDIDDLASVVAADAAARHAEAEKVERIARNEAEGFMRWLRSRAAVPVLAALRENFNRVRRQELAHHEKRLRKLSPQDRQLLERVIAALVNKLLHTPTTRLKKGFLDGKGTEAEQLLRELFGLEQDQEK
jgi:glutamyl-tRNA reductase